MFVTYCNVSVQNSLCLTHLFNIPFFLYSCFYPKEPFFICHFSFNLNTYSQTSSLSLYMLYYSREQSMYDFERKFKEIHGILRCSASKFTKEQYLFIFLLVMNMVEFVSIFIYIRFWILVSFCNTSLALVTNKINKKIYFYL